MPPPTVIVETSMAIVVTLIVTIAGFISIVAAVQDGRSSRQSRQYKISTRINQWKEVKNDPRYREAWFKRKICVNQSLFLKIAQLVENEWEAVHAPLQWNANFDITDRVALTLHYLAHPGTLDESATLIGMS
ncbi:UNVERIFIED_CONTAM: hypothetical protein HDU68_004323, partial [Siphonaria sp. JEL0065]